MELVNVLPFHKPGAAKYRALGIPFPLQDTPPPDARTVERVRERFQERGLRAD
ncbi:hypothetical protein [Streptomyces roseoverticillatus]|uniref:hypothetical protein n=1 Tax=Streptomyces roseoverticillatus TaxID=66429 RepID=UPI003F54253B